jgi:cell cycle checkpoint protein
MSDTDDRPIFSAVSSSARQLYLLLRCISFATKAQVQISEEGLRFSVAESSVLEGMVFLEKSLFTSFQYNAPPPPSPTSDASTEEVTTPTFAISLPSLLETLQIFGFSDPKTNSYNRDQYTTNAFSNHTLGISGSCRLSYNEQGSPLTIKLEEASVTTTCDLVTYEPFFSADIPFSRDALSLKVIMRASHLHDAITELSATNPQSLTLTGTTSSFTLSAASTLGSAVVEFHRDSKANEHVSTSNTDQDTDKTAGNGLLETFLVPKAFEQSYKFNHVANAKKALAAATKVSVRADEQGVLSLQFMVENLEAGGVSFVDFRFVPLVGEDEEGRREESDTEDEE